MNDKEITEIIATSPEVMGWERTEFNNWYTEQGNPRSEVVGQRNFTPLTSDADCMMAWDKFSEGTMTQIITNFNEDGEKMWWAYRESYNLGNDTDRRRAMCEGMVKAVTS